MPKLSRDIFVLAVGQALTSTVVSLLTSVSSLSGEFLAPKPALSTTPVSATVFGALIMIYPASSLMGRFGRRGGFVLKSAVGILGGALAATAMLLHSFITLVAGTFLLGIFSAFGQYYRFAAIDAAAGPNERATAVAAVTGAGAAGGVLGPFLGGRFAESLSFAPYAGAFITLSLVCVVLAASQLFLSVELGRDKADSAQAASTDFTFGGNFFKTSLICVIGFALMTLIMNAAPLSIHLCGYNVKESGAALQFHFALMYLPSFINPLVIGWIGRRGLVAVGAIAGGAGCLLSLAAHQTLGLYVVELGLSGVAWNFIFNGGTLLLADAYPPSLKTRAQGLNSMFVYSGNLLASFLAGALMASFGWTLVNLACIPLLALVIWASRAIRPIKRSNVVELAS